MNVKEFVSTSHPVIHGGDNFKVCDLRSGKDIFDSEKGLLREYLDVCALPIDHWAYSVDTKYYFLYV